MSSLVPTPKLGDALTRALARAEELSIFPRAALRIQRVVADPSSSLLDLEEAVCLDPSLSARLLRAANAPFFGLCREVGSVGQAIMVLGFEATRDLALALAVASVGSQRDPLREQLWSSALRQASAAQLLAGLEGGRFAADEAFVAGLTQDLGALVLLQLEPERYGAIASEGRAPGEQSARELSAFGFDHAALSAACLTAWGLPERLTDPVRYHHRPTDAEDSEVRGLAEELHVATMVAHGEESAEAQIQESLPELYESLGAEEGWRELGAALKERSRAWAAALS